MKNILITVLFLVIGLTQSLYGQGWLNVYGNEGTPESFLNVVETADHGYVAVTRTEFSFGGSQILLVRTDVDGNTIWEKYIGEPGQALLAFNLVYAQDGGILIMGSIKFPNQTDKDLFLLKTDAQGNTLWLKTFDFGGYTDNPGMIIQGVDGGFLFTNRLTFYDNIFVKINDVGEEEWTYTIPYDPNVQTSPTRVSPLSDGYLLSGLNKVVKVDLSGNEVWTQVLSSPSYNIISLSDGNFLVLTNFDDITLSKRNSTNGEEIWNANIEMNNGGNLAEDWIPIIETNDGGFILGQRGNFLAIVKTDHLGNELFRKEVGTNDLGITNLLYTSKEDIVYSGLTPAFGSSDSTDALLMKTTPDGLLFSNNIQGNVFEDRNFNCTFEEAFEDGVHNKIVQAIGNKTFYATTDEMGNYSINVDSGTYEVGVILPSLYWFTCLPQPVSITESNTDTIINLAAQAIIECPWLTVDVSTPFLRRCFENNYTVYYCNDGTASAEDAYVEVAFDPFLEVQSSTLPWTMQMGNTYTFDVGTLDPGDCGSFKVTTLVNCDSTILGQTHCTQAHIFPDSLCLPGAANWDGSSIAVEAECDGDSVRFTIRNIGDGNMVSPLSYIIIEDEIMVYQDDFQLDAGQSEMLANAYSSDGSTYRIIAEQANGHPGNSMPTAAIEGCGTTIFPFGFFNSFSQNDGDFYLSIDCQENIGAYDPNDKQAFPTGYGDEHFIWQNVDLEYLIRFQNTGTDTAFTVVIRDTLSEHLDITSLQMGVSSHNYTYEIDGTGVLKVRFDNILLPDSTTNLLGSNGFFKYKIEQKTDLPIGTMIYNEAAIYFDFNAPIITTETFHEVGEPFFGTTVFTNDLTTNNIKLNVFPNPFGDFTTFEIENLPEGKTEFLLYDNLGRLVREERVGDGKQFQFYREGLAAGLYFFEFRQAGVSVASGKMVAE